MPRTLRAGLRLGHVDQGRVRAEIAKKEDTGQLATAPRAARNAQTAAYSAFHEHIHKHPPQGPFAINDGASNQEDVAISFQRSESERSAGRARMVWSAMLIDLVAGSGLNHPRP